MPDLESFNNFIAPDDLAAIVEGAARSAFSTIDFALAFLRPVFPAVPSGNRWAHIARIVLYVHAAAPADLDRILNTTGMNDLRTTLGFEPITSPSITESADLAETASDQESAARGPITGGPQTSTPPSDLAAILAELSSLRTTVSALSASSRPAPIDIDLDLARPMPVSFLFHPHCIRTATSHPRHFRSFVDLCFSAVARTRDAVVLYRHFIEPTLLTWFRSTDSGDALLDESSPANGIRRLAVARLHAADVPLKTDNFYLRALLAERILEVLPTQSDSSLRSFDLKEEIAAAVRAHHAGARKRLRVDRPPTNAGHPHGEAGPPGSEGDPAPDRPTGLAASASHRGRGRGGGGR